MLILAALLLGFSITTQAYYDHRGVQIDSLEAVLRGPNPPKGEALLRVYMDLIRGYRSSDSKLCEEYAHRALALSRELNALNARCDALYNLGLRAYGRDDWDTAIDYYEQALAVADSMRSDRRYTEDMIDDNLSKLYGAIGNLYNMQDQPLLAIEYYQRALPIFERRGWMESQTILHHNVGELYLSMSNNEKAKEHYLKAIECGEATGDSLMMALPRKGLVKICLGEDDYERSREVLLPAYAYYHAHSDEEANDYLEILSSMTRLYLMEGHENLQQAQAFAQEALNLINEETTTETRCDVFAAAAEASMAAKQWKQALDYALQSVHEDSAATYSDATCYVLLAQIYTELGEKALARTYINKVYHLMSRFATEHYQSGISQMEVLYETRKKETAIKQLKEQQRWMTWGTALGGVVLLLTALLFFLLWRSVRLSKRNALIKAKLDGELEERVRIARDLHDRLGGMLTGIKMKSERMESERSANVEHTEADSMLTDDIDDAIREMRNISHHLLPDALRRHGLRQALRDYCQTMPGVAFSFVGEEGHVEHEETIYCIAYELVNNAVKSAQARHITLQLIAAEDYTAVNVCDDGKGMAESEGAKNEEGMGLYNIQERIAALGGTIAVCSEPGRGTEINVEIPRKT